MGFDRVHRPNVYAHRLFVLSFWLFLGLLAVTLLFRSPYFALHRVELRGSRLLTEEDLLAATGFSFGTPLYALDLAQGELKLKADPLVESARFKRKLPGTLVVDVVERRPVALLTSSERFWVVDAFGIPLFSGEDLSFTLPLMTYETPLHIEAGVPLDHPQMLAALRFAGVLSIPWLASLSEVHVTDEDITVYTRDGISISLGREGDMPEKARVLEGLLRDVEQGRLSVAHIDLRHSRSPAVRNRR